MKTPHLQDKMKLTKYEKHNKIKPNMRMNKMIKI